MKTVELVINITKCTIEIVDVCMRTFFTFRVSGLFTEPEMKLIVERVSHWTTTSDRILKEVFAALDPKSGMSIEKVGERSTAWLEIMEANVRFAQEFEKRFRMLCLQRIDHTDTVGDVSELFASIDGLSAGGRATRE